MHRDYTFPRTVPISILKVLVESLDRAFENVCELDLVFHFDEVCNPIFEPFSTLDDA